MEQNREPRNNPKFQWSINIQQRGSSIKWNKNNLFNVWRWESWAATCKKMKLEHQLTIHTKINSRWIKDLNISLDTNKVLEENIGRKISDIQYNNIFTGMSPRARDIKERINKWDLIKIKSFCMAKKISIKMKREPTVWENTFFQLILRQNI